ncbi:MAG: dTMP kinase [Candidatus Altiarchaeales archaeon ex4484_96]|nr:MAG: dTMP kinase [Candidatus Altiarchaeales archaeon ex4484_96]
MRRICFKTAACKMFIVLEGLDGCGKTSQAKDIRQWLIQKGYDVHLTGEPSNNKIGLFLRELLTGVREVQPPTLALLFTADRYWHLDEEIKPALDEGKIVLMERYVNSTIAYQAAQGVEAEWIRELNKNILKPDLTLFLDIKPEKAVKRADSGEIFENREFQDKVYEQYMKLDDMLRIDANKTQMDVLYAIKNAIGDRLQR